MPERGYHYLDTGSSKISRKEFTQLAHKYGIPARSFWQITKGESAHNKYVQQRDPGDGMVGYTLFQFTPNAWGDGAAKQYWNKLGGVQGMRNVENQFKMARFLYKSAGKSFKPWYGTRYLSDRSEEGEIGPVRKGMDISGGGSRTPGRRARYSIIPGVDKSPERQQALLGYLPERGRPGALLNLKLGLDAAQDVPSRRVQTQGSRPGSYLSDSGGGGGGPARTLPNTTRTLDEMMRIAQDVDKVNRKGKLPYLWGGGHGTKPAKVGDPVDCSGFVSQVLGVAPRVSGQFASSWGKPGKGKWVTVYADEGHVLMSMRDPRTGKVRWFGTSRSNPGGGAGEIDPPSKEYIARFTPRHPGRRK